MNGNGFAVRAEGLQKHYGEKYALDGFDLRVEQGAVHALLGPNGAGKTTAVRILATLVRQLGFPVISVLLYGFVFGEATKVPGGGDDGDYKQFLMPGMFVMTMAFGFMNTAMGVVTDASKGVIDLPQALKEQGGPALARCR